MFFLLNIIIHSYDCCNLIGSAGMLAEVTTSCSESPDPSTLTPPFHFSSFFAVGRVWATCKCGHDMCIFFLASFPVSPLQFLRRLQYIFRTASDVKTGAETGNEAIFFSVLMH